MNHSPPPPRAPGSPPDEGTAGNGEHGARPEERYGPLALQRTHKDDGRLLIFFRDTRVEQR